MAKFSTTLDKDHRAFIEGQPVFFVATAPADGRVNLSPKGMDTMRVLSPQRICWLSVTGSGNETAAHVLENGRMTLMWWASQGNPLILRVYGKASVVYRDSPAFDDLAVLFPPLPGARQIFDLEVESVQTSCGMSLPIMDFVEERKSLVDWALRKGEEGVRAYQAKNNVESIDGLPTGVKTESSEPGQSKD